MWALPHSHSCLCLKLDDGKKKEKKKKTGYSDHETKLLRSDYDGKGVSGDVIRKFKSTRQVNSSFPTSLLESQTFSNLFCPFALAPLLLEIPSFSSSSHSERSIFFTNLSQLLSFLRVTTAVSVQFIHSVVSNSVTQWNAAHQASLSITNSQGLVKLMSIELVIPSNHLILCHPLLLLPSIFPSIRVFSNESSLHIRWPKYRSFSISPSNEYSGLISFKID